MEFVLVAVLCTSGRYHCTSFSMLAPSAVPALCEVVGVEIKCIFLGIMNRLFSRTNASDSKLCCLVQEKGHLTTI
jgi:hypothetical protein